jgi:type IV pilus assembly protein PilA
MLQRLRAKREDEGGFTLIELLVVILIIAILAAIAIPVFLRQREKGWRSQMQAGLKEAATAYESWSTENNGSYATAGGVGDLEPGGASDQGLNYAADVTLTEVNADVDSYCVEATHNNLAETWHLANSPNAAVASGEPLQGACPAGV